MLREATTSGSINVITDSSFMNARPVIEARKRVGDNHRECTAVCGLNLNVVYICFRDRLCTLLGLRSLLVGRSASHLMMMGGHTLFACGGSIFLRAGRQ